MARIAGSTGRQVAARVQRTRPKAQGRKYLSTARTACGGAVAPPRLSCSAVADKAGRAAAAPRPGLEPGRSSPRPAQPHRHGAGCLFRPLRHPGVAGSWGRVCGVQAYFRRAADLNWLRLVLIISTRVDGVLAKGTLSTERGIGDANPVPTNVSAHFLPSPDSSGLLTEYQEIL